MRARVINIFNSKTQLLGVCAGIKVRVRVKSKTESESESMSVV